MDLESVSQDTSIAIRRRDAGRGKTPGIDNVIWSTPQQKLQAVQSLKRHGYKTKPLRRIYIPKKSGTKELRPLSIPSMRCRAMQALHLLALEPVAEHYADKNSYGFRPKRSCAMQWRHALSHLREKARPSSYSRAI